MERLILAFAVSCFMAVLIAPRAIKLLRRMRFGQFIRDDSPQAHLAKQGTPIMGGIIMAAAVSVSMLLLVPYSEETAMACLAAAGFTMIGFADDYLKIRHKASLGLKGRYKFLGQVAFAGIIAVFAFNRGGGLIRVPFLSEALSMGWAYIPFAMFIIIGASNGMNFADGIDGLAAGSAAASIGTYGIIAMIQGQEGLAAFAAAIVGACLAFLLYNSHPADIFMGDTGSLGLGGALGAMAVLTGNELLLSVIGLLYAIEVLSSVIQVYYIRRLNRRLFKMAPIHHHFEMIGYPEAHVSAGFWLFAMLTGAAGLIIYLRG